MSKHLDIVLDKKEAFIGETVKGILIITTNNTIKAKHLKLEAYGEEKTKVHEKEYSLELPFKHTKTIISCKRFLSVDLSPFLKSADMDLSSKNGSIKITQGIKRQIPFQFVIPENALESYNGKNVWIDYKIKAVIDRSFLRSDITYETSFTVLCPPRITLM